jgi:uncharacterized protein
MSTKTGSSFVRLFSALGLICTMLAGTFVATPKAYAFTQNPATVFINEFHYDNASTDSGEFIEIAGPAGTDLTGWSLVLYNGNTPTAAVTYDTDPLPSPIPDLGGGFGIVVLNYPVNGIQNGGNDAIALVNNTGTVVQFLSYEGVVTASNGPATGLTSTDIGVSQAGSEAAGTSSLHLIGSGTTYQDFTWAATTTARSSGAVNTGQTFSAVSVTPTLSINNVTLAEENAGTTTFSFAVSLSAPAGAGGVSFDIATADNTATTADNDYTANSLTSQTIPQGNSSYTFDVTVNGDTTIESTETFFVNITNIVGANAGDSQGQGTITNDDSPPTDTAPSVTSTTPANGATNVAVGDNLTVTFSEAVTAPASAFSLNCGSAVAFNLSGGPTTFTLDPSGDLPTSTSCTLAIDGDQISDNDTIDPPDTAVDTNVSFTTAGPVVACPANPSIKKIHEIQGSGSAAAFTGAATIEGVVTGIFPGLSGFYMQEENADQDASVTTSEGVFIFLSGNFASFTSGITVNDVVRVSGTAQDRSTTNSGVTVLNTQLTSVTAVTDCGTTSSPTPVSLSFPLTSLDDLEPYEGMLVTFPQELVIGEYFNYDRFGEIVVGLPLAGQDRFYTPTSVTTPGAAANALAAQYALRRITLDDGSSASAPTSIPHPNGALFSANNRFRGGDTLTNVTGTIEQTFGVYRVQPTQGATYTAKNPRPAAPSVAGRITVATYNVLNYFPTIDTTSSNNSGACGPLNNADCRGADSNSEFTRQRSKLIEALKGLNADVYGLIELENSTGVDPLNDPTRGIIPGLNAAISGANYAAINTGVVGTDAIRVAIIYNTNVVSPVGSFAILNTATDARFIDTKNRPALAQTFEEIGTGERFTVVVNHLKSKGSDCLDSPAPVGADPDLGDGQGNCNLTRKAAAEALVDWLATDPTLSGDPDFLIVGDLNSYAMEDPIRAIEVGADDNAATTADNYINLVKQFGGEFAYSYVFDGQAGYLDYAMANTALASQVAGVTEWHINADEPDFFDYNDAIADTGEASSERRGFDVTDITSGIRTSDHDPVLVGLNLNSIPPTPTVSITAEDAAAAEAGSDVGTFRLSRTGDTTNALPVDYTIGGSATNGSDYTPNLTGQTTIPAGASFIDITLTPVDDTTIEGSETATLTLVDGAAYDPGSPSSATVTIVDNDVAVAPTITTEPQSQTINAGATATLSVVATGTEPLNYQWYQGATGVTTTPVGTNSPNFTTPALNTTTSYWVRVSNSVGSDDSLTATVTVITRISAIQGTGSAITGTGPFTVEAIVVGDYQTQGSGQLRGFFLQEEDADADNNPATSEGIFVFCTTCPVAVSVGDKVRATGSASEFFNMSQLTASTAGSVTVISSNNTLPTSAIVQLPVPGVPSGDQAAATAAINAYFEAFEGMLVTFPDTLSVSEYFELARYGQVILSEGGRPRQFTDQNTPSTAGYTNHQIDLDSRTIILDDTDNRQNRPVDTPNTAYYYPVPGLSTSNFFRGGDTITNLTGVLHWSFAGQSGTDAWRIRPVVEKYSYAFTPTNPRPAVPAVGGSLKVASFNVLNYFLTIDTTSSSSSGTCGASATLDCRGPDNTNERDQQQAKLTAALNGLNADVFGLIELENTPSVDPLAEIVSDLNAVAGAGTYAAINTGVVGTDAIKVGLIYKPAAVTPIGSPLIDNDAVHNRPPVAQLFEDNNGARFTVIVNHFKSKGCDGATGTNLDQGDGQGCFNTQRVQQAQALLAFINAIIAQTGDSDVLIIGDLNAYAKEGPITTLTNAGFTNLVAQFGGSDAYSYVFDGQLGYLDHALASASLVSQISGTAEWHINADEIPLFDYNDTTKDTGEATFEEESDTLPLYQANEFRTSDHDPVIVGLNLTAPVPPCTTVCYADVANGDDANPGTQALPKKTIQAAINQVASGGTVIVAAGTYEETLIANKPVTIEGAGKDVLAKNRPGAQSIIRVASGGTVALDIQADNVTVNGFVFNLAGSTTPWAINALSGPGDGRYQNVRVLNNEFIGNGSATQNNPGGLYLLNHDDALIEGNFFNALGSHAVFMAGSSTNAIYRNNDSFRNFLSNFSTHTSTHTNVLIENNRMVEDSAILFQLRDSTIRNNSLSSAADASGRIYLGGGGNNVLIEGNSWTSVRSQAILVFDAGFGYGINSNITVRDNTIATNVATLSASNSLIDLRDVGGSSLVGDNSITLSGTLPSGAGAAAVYGIGLRGNIASVTISDNELQGGNVDADAGEASSGILLRNTLAATTQVTIENNLISGFINGIEAQAFVAGASVNANENSLAGNVNGFLNAASTSLNGERNWWGSDTGPTNAGNPGGSGSTVSGNVDFSPWLCDGTDTSTDRGFQPNPEASPCGPQVGSLTITKTVNWGDFPVDSSKVFTLTVNGPDGYSNSQTVDYDGGSFTLENLAPGSYTISEASPGADWNTPTITPSTVNVVVGETVTATVSNTHKAFTKLQLTSLCSDFPALSRNWRVRNPNSYPVTYVYEVYGTAQTGTLVANPGDNFFSTVTVAGPNTTLIKVNGVQQDVKASGGTTCGTVGACYASGKQTVENFVQGKRKNNTAVLASRSNPSKALGLPQRNDTENFVSLGFGGTLTIRFNNVIVNGSGNDIRVWETSFGDRNQLWSRYPEAVRVEASQDGITWVTLGTTSDKDQPYDLKTLPWARFIKLTDISDKASTRFISSDDGFDVDAIEVLNGCAPPPAQ